MAYGLSRCPEGASGWRGGGRLSDVSTFKGKQRGACGEDGGRTQGVYTAREEAGPWRAWTVVVVEARWRSERGRASLEGDAAATAIWEISRCFP